MFSSQVGGFDMSPVQKHGSNHQNTPQEGANAANEYRLFNHSKEMRHTEYACLIRCRLLPRLWKREQQVTYWADYALELLFYTYLVFSSLTYEQFVWVALDPHSRPINGSHRDPEQLSGPQCADLNTVCSTVHRPVKRFLFLWLHTPHLSETTAW